jgi:hypothetical protein
MGNLGEIRRRRNGSAWHVASGHAVLRAASDAPAASSTAKKLIDFIIIFSFENRPTLRTKHSHRSIVAT